MIIIFKYTNKTNPLDVQEGAYTSLAHKKWHESKYPYLVNDYDAVDITAEVVRKIKTEQYMDRASSGFRMMAYFNQSLAESFKSGTLTKDQVKVIRQSIKAFKENVKEGNFEEALEDLQALGPDVISQEMKEEFVKNIQATLTLEDLELNPPDTHPVELIGEEPAPIDLASNSKITFEKVTGNPVQ